MGRPVIVDDGGSIRIKFNEDPSASDKHPRGKMDGLFNVEKGTSPKWESSEVVKGHGQGPSTDYEYSNARLAYVDENGLVSSNKLVPFQKDVVVFTDRKLKVKLEIKAKKLKVSILSDGDEPIIESRGNNRKRGYVVVNGGNINKVEFDGVQANMPVKPTIYLGVVIT